jgi:hypothetical protein
MRKEREKAEKNHYYEGQTELDFSHMDFELAELDGNKYPNSITSINLGDNYLSQLKVANFPNLQRLIISHNKKLIAGETLIIKNCPKLNSTYDYKSGDENRQAPTEGRVYDEAKDNPFKKEAQSKELEEEQNFLQITQLIKQIESALTNNNLNQASELLTELKELAEQPNSLIQADQLNATIAGLASRLATATNQTAQSQSIPTKLIIGSLSVSLVIIGVMF